MSTIFAGGSRSITRLPAEAARRISNIMANKHHVIVGDAGGADTAIQRCLLDAAYDNVEVFCSGPRFRNNLGSWATHHIQTARETTGFQFYAAKDRAMAETAGFGLMIWDGKSPGTILNILRLLRGKRPAVLISPAHISQTFKLFEDWQTFLGTCRPQLVHALKQRAAANEWVS